MKWYLSTRAKFGLAVGASSLLSVGIFLIGALANQSWDFWYFTWNLLLAWVPLLMILMLERSLRHRSWSDWQPIVLTLLFLAFLPNTFYMITDIIHLQEPV